MHAASRLNARDSPGRAAVKGAPRRFDNGDTGPAQPIGQRGVGERDDLVAVGLDVAVQVADEMADARGFRDVARARRPARPRAPPPRRTTRSPSWCST